MNKQKQKIDRKKRDYKAYFKRNIYGKEEGF
jgi:hypothetical protein